MPISSEDSPPLDPEEYTGNYAYLEPYQEDSSRVPDDKLVSETSPPYLSQPDLFSELATFTQPENVPSQIIEDDYEWPPFPLSGQEISIEPEDEIQTTESVCSNCGGAGFVVLDLPLDDPDFGKAMPCDCREMDFAERRQGYLLRLSGVDALAGLTFENFISDPMALQVSKETAHNLRRAHDTCLQFAYEPEGWLILTGRYGCGKTHLAAAIANTVLRIGQAVIFMVVPDLLDHLRSTFNPRSELSYDDLFEQMRTTPLLILDDLGTQSSTPWAQEKLFQLLNHRYNTQAPTVITTNQRLESLEQRLHSRLLDFRLVQQFGIIAPDYRAAQQAKESDLSSLSFHKDQMFDNFESYRADINAKSRENLHEVAEACRKFAQAPGGWLVLSGTYGCGKTHLASAIANHQVDIVRNEVMFVVVPDLLDHLRAAFSPEANTSYDRRFNEIKNTPLLILDDLGTESATPWAREKLFQLLNHRYNARLATVITTSDGPKEIEPRLRTRMFDKQRCQFFAITAEGYRGSLSNDMDQ